MNPVLLGVPFAVYGIKTEQIIYAALGVAIGTLVQRITSRRAQELLKQGKETLANTTLEQRV